MVSRHSGQALTSRPAALPAFGDTTGVPTPVDGGRRLPALLLTMTVLTGLVDSVSFLGLGRVFVANMTGNVVFLAFALAGAPGLSADLSALALAGFLTGAALADHHWNHGGGGWNHGGGGWNHGGGGWDHGGGWRGGGFGPGFAFGFGSGALFGGGYPYGYGYGPGYYSYYAPPPVYYPRPVYRAPVYRASASYCASRFRTYNPNTGMYNGSDGRLHACR